MEDKKLNTKEEPKHYTRMSDFLAPEVALYASELNDLFEGWIACEKDY